MGKTAMTKHLSALAVAALVAFSFAPAHAGDAEAGAKIFKSNCGGCHSLDTSKNAFGPSLIGVMGRKAGTLARYAYSPAMSGADFTWDETMLRRWILNNEAAVPGTRMRYISITDTTQQDNLIAFIATLK